MHKFITSRKLQELYDRDLESIVKYALRDELSYQKSKNDDDRQQAIKDQIIKEQADKIRTLTKQLDERNGTPCEQIKHQQEVEDLQHTIESLKGKLEDSQKVTLSFMQDYTELKQKYEELKREQDKGVITYRWLQGDRGHLARNLPSSRNKR